eukprot:13227115-Alexandrium_andersonii.AAC.1
MGKGGPPPHKLNEASSEPPPNGCRTLGRRCLFTLAWGAAKRRPKSLYWSALARIAALWDTVEEVRLARRASRPK